MKIEVITNPNFTDTLSSVRLPFKKSADVKYYLEHGKLLDRDLSLLSKLVVKGPDHSKAIRGVWVTFKIQAPRYWWSEFDTYKIGVQTLSSESSMHTIISRDLVKSDFENGNVLGIVLDEINAIRIDSSILPIERINKIKKLLPEGYLQTRISQINYQALRNIYKQRHNHRLHEWKFFCGIISQLEYADKLIII